jgi:hypothetical protein
MFKKYIRSAIEIVALILIIYLLFFRSSPKPTPATVDVINPPHTDWKADPNTATVDQLRKWALTPISMDYTIPQQTDSYMILQPHAWVGDLKDGYATWKITYPVAQYNNLIGVSAGLWYDSRAKPFWAPLYYRRITGQIFLGGGPQFEWKTFRGASVSVLGAF